MSATSLWWPSGLAPGEWSVVVKSHTPLGGGGDGGGAGVGWGVCAVIASKAKQCSKTVGPSACGLSYQTAQCIQSSSVWAFLSGGGHLPSPLPAQALDNCADSLQLRSDHSGSHLVGLPSLATLWQSAGMFPAGSYATISSDFPATPLGPAC